MKDTKWLLTTRIAHRGLHDNKTIPENSMKAFRNAVEHGFGIEFDVYLTLDGRLIIHHDPVINRTCGMKVRAVDIDTNNLEKYKLFGTDEHIPLLFDMLRLVDGKVPLVLEIKATNRIDTTCKAIYDMIRDYPGNIAIESFDKLIVDWWLNNHPEYVIGQLYGKGYFTTLPLKLARQYKRVDFIALACENLSSKYFRRIKSKRPNMLIINWTVKTRENLNNALKYADNYIFEHNAKDNSYISLDDIK